MLRKRNARYPERGATFDTTTDSPLGNFSTKDVFVNKSTAGNYKLYCDNRWLVATVTYNGFLYIFPAYTHKYDEYMKMFLSQYAPHVDFKSVKRYAGTTHYEYIGTREPSKV